MTSIATRPASDVCRGLERLADLPVVEDAYATQRAAVDCKERVAVVRLERGIERVPPSVLRILGQEDFGVETIERECGGGRREVRIEVILR